MTPASMCLRMRVLLLFVLAAMFVATPAHADPPEHGHWGLQKHRTSRVKRSKNTYGSHYFLSSTAIPLKRHDGFYKNTLVSLNSVAYGLTNNLSVGASLDLVSLIRSREGGPIYSGRLQLSGPVSEIVHIGASVQYLNVRVPVGADVPEGTELPPGFAVAMGMVTIGSMNNQITVAGGWTHDGENAGDGPVLNIGGALRLFANVMLVTENWIFTDPSEPFLTHSLGCRILGDDLAIDIGLAYDDEVTTKVTPVGMPFLSATLNF
jgi:hypothetical protein